MKLLAECDQANACNQQCNLLGHVLPVSNSKPHFVYYSGGIYATGCCVFLVWDLTPELLLFLITLSIVLMFSSGTDNEILFDL